MLEINSPEQQKQSPLSVSQLNRRARQLLETQFPMLWVEGEISNLARPASGHIYLTLKDKQAQVRACMFRNQNSRLNFKPENGTQVLVRCRVGLYEGRGEFQLIIEHMEEAGFGELQRQFELLKRKLEAQGLFEQNHKQPLPNYPKSLGVITSASGAALHDVLSVLQKRFPFLPVTVYPSLVQGEGAPEQLCKAIEWANTDLVNNQPRCDVLLLTRGGGSLEDLWAFNNEALAHCIYNSKLPIVSAVGHEVDFTIADFVADVRAATPSAAAELISPDQDELLAQINAYDLHLNRQIKRSLKHHNVVIDNLSKRLRHPKERLQDIHQRIDNTELRLKHALDRKLKASQSELAELTGKLQINHPRNRLKAAQTHNHQLSVRLNKIIQQRLTEYNQHCGNLAALLHSVSPLQVLDRGYAVATDKQGNVIKSINQISKGSKLTAQVADGLIHCEVDNISPKSTKLS